LAMGSLSALETSATELWSAFVHEQRRLFDLFMLSQEQQTVLDAERTAGATRRHDQKATVLAIEGAISVLANDGINEVDVHTRGHVATAVRAELARLRRGLEQTQLVDLKPVALREVLTPLVVCMRSEGVNVRLAVPAGMVIETNTDCLLEIVQNLVDNAATHGKNRSIVITANLAGDGFDLAVSDRGPGVPEALRDVIFERGVTSRAADHSGLGLFSANQLAQRLGGTLGVESARRGGARFVLRVGSIRGDR
jgi:signal transduction histidine kinase